MPFSFSRKIAVALWLPALAALLASGFLAWNLLASQLEQRQRSDLARLVAAMAPAETQLLPEDPSELQRWTLAEGERIGLRVTVIAIDGTVLSDSERSREGVLAMDNHLNRPEVVSSLGGGVGTSVRASNTLGRRFVYAATVVDLGGGERLVLRLAEPIEVLELLRRTVTQSVLLATSVSLLVGILVAWVLYRRLTVPLEGLIAGAEQLLDGSAPEPITVPEERDLSSLAEALNQLSKRAAGKLEEVEAERKHLLAVLGSMSEGVLVTDAAGEAILVNPRWRELFDSEAPAGESDASRMSLDARVRGLISEALSGGENLTEEVDLTVQGPPRTVVLASSRLSDESGAVVLARDITPFLRLAEIRRDFVANVSHELKTPLSAIRGYAETLEAGALDDEEVAAPFIGRILRQCARLEALLTDLLALSRLEHPGTERERHPVDLSAVVRRAADNIEEQAQSRGVRLAVEASAVPTFKGDSDSLERMVTNLLGNAVKYNRPDGEVSVRLEQRGRELLLEVADTGIGIPPAALDRVFERFYRVDKGRSREEGGTGLGLAIVKHATHLHGGRVEVESTLGKGSTFRIWLPLERT